MKGWHFLREDRRLGYEDGRVVKVGETITVPADTPLVLCKSGLHASSRIIDALKYAPGPVACQVEIVGEILEEDDKACAYERRCISMVDATNVLHEFACLCAEKALSDAGVKDERCWAAIAAKRKWLRGEITDEELASASAASDAAAWAAAAAAAYAAASDAAASASAAAAAYAASAAAWAAASASAAASAARAEQNERLEAMVLAECRKGATA